MKSLLCIALVASSCYSPSFTECRLLCSSAGTCPAGYACDGRVCRSLDRTSPCAPPNPDAAADAAPPQLPRWGEPQLVRLVAGVRDLSLTANQLEVYFSLNGAVQYATRTNLASPFSTPLQLAVFADTAGATAAALSPTVSLDGGTLHFTSGRLGGASSLDIWRSTGLGTTWAPPEPVAELNGSQPDGGGAMSEDQRTLIFYRDLPEVIPEPDTGYDLYTATRAPNTAVWSNIVRLDSLTSPSSEDRATITADANTIVFQRRDATSGADLYQAVRASSTQPFGAPQPIASLNLPGLVHDGAPWISPDGKTLYFVSDRPANGVSNFYAYVSQRL